LWLYEENRVEGALVVVAETSPAGAPATTATQPAQAYAAPDVPRPVPAASPVPVQPAAAPDVVRPLPEVAAAAPPPVDVPADRTVKTVETATPGTPDVEAPKRAPRQAAHKRPPAKTHRARTQEAPPPPRAAAEPSPRQRREETLMQCRAHGYDERQCFEHACTMTRYGLVCRG
jgi:hypothetical protein